MPSLIAAGLNSTMLVIALFALFALFAPVVFGSSISSEHGDRARCLSDAVAAVLIALDGESNWYGGAELLAVYAIVALAFVFYP